jgi:predicted dehydrogenase
MTTSIRVGVIGVGHMGKEHARVYAGIPNATLSGVFDGDADTARKIAKQNKCAAYSTDSFEAFLAAVDGVSLATPTSSHFELGQKILQAGKHLLVEKPITNTTEEAKALVTLAQEKNLVLQVGHIERFNPVLQALEERLTRPRFIEAHRLSPYPGRSTDISVVMDLMIHDLEIILHLVSSPVQSVDAVGIPVLSKSEDIANVRIRFENGCVANITTSRISPEKMRKIRVFQDDAYLSLDYQKQEGEMYRKKGSEITREKIPVAKDEPLKRQLQSFVDCIQNKSLPVVSGDHGTRALQLAAQIADEIARTSPRPDWMPHE